jgi:two-component system OmpR family response regulator
LPRPGVSIARNASWPVAAAANPSRATPASAAAVRLVRTGLVGDGDGIMRDSLAEPPGGAKSRLPHNPAGCRIARHSRELGKLATLRRHGVIGECMSPSEPTLSLSRLLYVDDDPTLTLLTRISLERVGGFTVKTCASGTEALAEVGAFAPGLILLDVMMPGLDGPATLQALRRMKALDGVPVVFMTAKVTGDEAARYRELGAADVIGKPYDPVKLPDLVRAIWQRCRG